MNDLPHELARTLADRAGLGTPKSLEPLAGGRNNRVFRVDFKRGEAAVLKSYYHDRAIHAIGSVRNGAS